ncbi:SDR family oxidoreductase [Nonomuraea sp. NPDC023979]|uniref:SDR family oxidoreductase n=1 Tax=Nonomuraea sp. NPDC023979 TaxID=3154796 RepID=UPI0033E5DC6A
MAVVSGAAQGIGAAVCARLAADGATIAALDVDEHGLKELSATVPDVLAQICDVRDPRAVQAAISHAERDAGPIAIAVSVAGVLRSGPVTALTEPDLRELFAVNTMGVIHLCQAVTGLMISRRAGAIITVASNAAHVPRIGLAGYGASKAAALAFTRHLALEVAEYGIRCNSVSPGSTDTPMLAMLTTPEQAIAGDPARFRLGIPLRRIAHPHDIADAVAWLASDQARHVTMQDLVIDGGASLTG